MREGGRTLSNGFDVTSMNNKNPMALVRGYIEDEGLRLVDFFRLMDKDGGGSISRQEFLEGMQVLTQQNYIHENHSLIMIRLICFV